MKIAKGSIDGFMPSYQNVQTRIIITLILFIILIISLVIALFKWIKNWNEISKKTKIKYITTSIFMVITVVAIIYFDMYEFWNL